MEVDMTWKPKPPEAKWTNSQWEAISRTGTNLLVSAAAGSGKTAVLVERILHKITDKESPVDIDRLLVVTFTNAAAAEMKNRIADALKQEMNNNPGSLHLRRQLSLLNRAQISTLHSFCMSLIRKYYHKVNIDPKFRILDEMEGELMREEILDELMERKYSEEDNGAFLEAADRFSGDRSDEGWRNVIQKLYRFSRAHPNPSEWLDHQAARYQIDEEQSIETSVWGRELWEDAKKRLMAALSLIEKAKDLCSVEDGPSSYLINLEQDEEELKNILHSSSWQDMYFCFHSLHFGRLKSIKKKDNVDEELKQQVKNLREHVKKDITNLKNEAFYQPPEDFLKDVRNMAPSVKVLVDTVKQFSHAYQKEKEEKGVVDFSDLEHISLSILTDEQADAAKECQHRFAEILVDEYQDVNQAQEAILQAITNSNNLFLVGDVKQSVYRFRLAEPGLFLSKYKDFNRTDGTPGWKIDLDQNFRSREEVLHASNFIFKQIMDENVGEVAYDNTASLKAGNMDYPPRGDLETDLVLINKGEPIEDDEDDEEGMESEEDAETAQLEARWIARKIKQLIEDKHEVFDKELKKMRKITYRDVVILMRSMPWAAAIMDEFKKEGLPVYADTNGGYFKAVEINIMLSLLQTIDNPNQDIPLVSVLRSPIVGMDEEELAHVRMMDRHNSYFRALKETVKNGPASPWHEKAIFFYQKLLSWRDRARGEELSDFIWDLLQETGYYDFVGGLPGGKQRQANLLALYDRARAYEKTNFRGLFRFLRFIERMQEKGDDLGTARALGEQEDVIRLMTVHKSKGLEFPIVFVAGLNKRFNMQDIYDKVLIHKDLGIGTKHIDPKARTVKDSLPQLAAKKRMYKEAVSEEMRVLYVAMTRAKEKVYLIGTLNHTDKKIEKWQDYTSHKEWVLPEMDRLRARSYADWIGPAIFRHHSVRGINSGFGEWNGEIFAHPSRWSLTLVEKHALKEADEVMDIADDEIEEALRNQQLVNLQSNDYDMVDKKLSWDYPYQNAVTKRSKQTVSEFKRTMQDEYSEPSYKPGFRSANAERPLFLQQTKARPAERGTAVHTVMEHIPLQTEASVSTANCQRFLSTLVEKELLTQDQADMIDTEEIISFFHSSLGKRLREADDVYREIPFSYGKKTNEEEDTVLIQGAVDCVFRDINGQLVLLDYKTDSLQSRYPGNINHGLMIMKERYQPQIELYREALSTIWEENINEAYLYMFDGDMVIDMMNGEG